MHVCGKYSVPSTVVVVMYTSFIGVVVVESACMFVASTTSNVHIFYRGSSRRNCMHVCS